MFCVLSIGKDMAWSVYSCDFLDLDLVSMGMSLYKIFLDFWILDATNVTQGWWQCNLCFRPFGFLGMTMQPMFLLDFDILKNDNDMQLNATLGYENAT